MSVLIKRLLNTSFTVAVLLGASQNGDAEVTIEWVAVGNPGNTPDPYYEFFVPGIGKVDYEYRIARFELTNDQYAEFLNAVAMSDPNGLYHVNMADNPRGGIVRGGSPGVYSYVVKPNMGNKPVNYVSFFDAMRFVNWLHHGQPTGLQSAGTTEDGAYVIDDGLSETRAEDARYFLPTENEWYKAAHHHPSEFGGDQDDYWLFATASNKEPEQAFANVFGDIFDPGPNIANFDFGVSWNGTFGNVTTVGSAGPLSESYYRTADQNGNVKEWNETLSQQSFRVSRGGSWGGRLAFMMSSSRGSTVPEFEDGTLGFRVAAPPLQLLADLDADRDVDLSDYLLFAMAFIGPFANVPGFESHVTGDSGNAWSARHAIGDTQGIRVIEFLTSRGARAASAPMGTNDTESQDLGLEFSPADFDADGDVDLFDLSVLQLEFTGENH